MPSMYPHVSSPQPQAGAGAGVGGSTTGGGGGGGAGGGVTGPPNAAYMSRLQFVSPAVAHVAAV